MNRRQIISEPEACYEVENAKMQTLPERFQRIKNKRNGKMVSSKMPNLMSQSSDESFLTHGGQQRIPEDQDIPPENGEKRECGRHRCVEFGGNINSMYFRSMYFPGNPVDLAVCRSIFSAVKFQKAFPGTIQH